MDIENMMSVEETIEKTFPASMEDNTPEHSEVNTLENVLDTTEGRTSEATESVEHTSEDNTPESVEEVVVVKTFLQETQECFESLFDERKSIIRPEVDCASVTSAMEKLMPSLRGLTVDIFESADYESTFEVQKIFLNLVLIYNHLNKTKPDPMPLNPEVRVTIIGLLKSFFDYLESLLTQHQDNMIKSVKSNRRVKAQILLLSLISFSLKLDEDYGSFLCKYFTREDFFSIFSQIAPKPYNYNLFMCYYSIFLRDFAMAIQDPKTQRIVSAVLETIRKMFPESDIVPFSERYELVMNTLYWGAFDLEKCYEKIETSAYTLSSDSPIEAAIKMVNIWFLLEASKFVSFDDNRMIVYVFSSELLSFHTQFMRIFFVLNRIDENILNIGYSSYSTPKFIEYYLTVYTEMHNWFSKLIRAVSRNYEIRELEYDSLSGSIKRKLDGRPFIAAELRELSIQMTFPLATLDSILRLSLNQSDIPTLLNEEQEKFMFTSPSSSLLPLHDFVASDREKFATHTIELYPCLDNHFHRFHKSKKTESQGINTALPPSYYLFSKSVKPPEYQMYYTQPSIYQTSNIPMSKDDVEAQRVMESIRAASESNRSNSLFKRYVPAVIIFIIIIVGIIVLANV